MSANIDAGELLVETHDNILLLRINRPKNRNALSAHLRRCMVDAVEGAEADQGIRAIVLTGTDDFFCAGGDINEFQSVTASTHHDQENSIWKVLAERRKTIIAAVEGYALGGGLELALMTDIIVAGETVKFAFPEVKLGILPGAGGTQRFPRHVGMPRALRYLLTGDRFSAVEAQTMGLISNLAPAGKALETALGIARTIARHPPLAVEQIRRVVLDGDALPLPRALEIEAAGLRLLRQTQDHREGVRAFLEKRPPHFSGR
ncbi:enoyl-CoA hydratase [Methylovirgula ligni]|uniref:Short chain enoyl-CoA hydratase n=1 Tax=Methylovirgula ligni TaxID=569860 RepID=A0A3D9Z279_9HYPH|nr:enoyl-CoA hydratase-related protein [Methylovirgula ligni]QAY95495.1 enoyl-CoA hydratase [Methylovirgula ligni]REF89171.1 short chain enoyl-CoA hydratase [Methylovirgula ligni]